MKHLAWVTIFLILYNFCANLSNDIYLPCLPELVTRFDSTSSMLRLTMTAWFAGVALPQLFLGPMCDRYGRRPILLIGGMCFISATMICMLANNVEMLIIGRFLQGLGVCSLNVTSYAILMDLYPYHARIKIMNRMSMVGTLAPLIGPVLGGYILIYLGWRANFMAILILGLFSVLGLAKCFTESQTELNQQALKVRHVFGNYAQLLRNKIYLNHVITFALLLGGLVAYLTAAPFIIIKKLHIAPEYFGYTQLPIFALYILGALFVNRQTDEQTMRKTLNFGVKLLTLGSFLMIVLGIFFINTLWILILPMMLYVFGFSLCGSPLIAEAMSSVRVNNGMASAFLGFCMAISCTLSCLVLEVFYNGTSLSLGILLFVLSMIGLRFYLSLAKYAVEVVDV